MWVKAGTAGSSVLGAPPRFWSALPGAAPLVRRLGGERAFKVLSPVKAGL